ncbi:MAG TPA: hypothetical protein VNX65_03825, partial [Patescibacteria group bacterium]|nr:hypothetical protein [Patescibacteria group bacterium]
ITTFYSTPVNLQYNTPNANSCPLAFVGKSTTAGWFAIIADSGNLQIKKDRLSIPRAGFVSASCSQITGYAFDGRQPDQKVKVYLFFGGPPGIGKVYGPIVANKTIPEFTDKDSHSFAFAVPAEYRNGNNIPVWGAMQPMRVWSEPYVQFSQPTTINKACSTPTAPIVSCESLSISMIERTKLKLNASAQSQQVGLINGYRYTIKDSKDQLVFNKYYQASTSNNESEVINLQSAGNYSAKVVVDTTTNSPSSQPQCTATFKIAAPGNCMFKDQISASSHDCLPCPSNQGIWIKDNDCVPAIVSSKQVHNLTRNINDANNTAVLPDNRIEYTLYTTNLGSAPIATKVEENFAEVLRYSSMIDSSGGAFMDGNILSWGNVTIGPGKSDVRRVVVQINNSISPSAVGANDPLAYNCVVTNAYGNTTRLKVACPFSKQIESVIQKLPNFGVKQNLAFSAGLFVIIYYFYQRARLLNKEERLRHKIKSLATLHQIPLQDLQQHLSLPSRLFSILVHNNLIAFISYYASRTLVRPKAIIVGSFMAFIVVLSLYVMARYIGFAISGFEIVGTFILGWAIGLAYDTAKSFVTRHL